MWVRSSIGVGERWGLNFSEGRRLGFKVEMKNCFFRGRVRVRRD